MENGPASPALECQKLPSLATDSNWICMSSVTLIPVSPADSPQMIQDWSQRAGPADAGPPSEVLEWMARPLNCWMSMTRSPVLILEPEDLKSSPSVPQQRCLKAWIVQSWSSALGADADVGAIIHVGVDH